MKNRITKTVIVAFAIAAALSVSTAQAQDKAECQQAVAHFNSMDPTIQGMLNSAAGYAVFPNVGKGGFIVGGARGKGCVFEQGKVTGQATMTQASIGAQAGGQSFAELIIFQDTTALNSFKSSNFELSAGVSAVAVRQGVSQSARFDHGVAVLTMANKGLMAEAAVGGQKFKFQPMSH